MPNRPNLLTEDIDFELLHQRQHETRVHLVDPEHLLVRGAIVDTKPPGLFIESDPDWLEIHRMEVELKVRLVDLTIVDANVRFETHPYETCPTITESYKNLIGLRVARGFNRRVRELFGGPRGCTHTTALLQAMAPAVHQSMWSVSMKLERMASSAGLTADQAEARRDRAVQANLNTCHIWEEGGTAVQFITRGGRSPTPEPIRERREALGLGEGGPGSS